MTHIAMNEEASELTAAIGTRLLTYGDPFEGKHSKGTVRNCIRSPMVLLPQAIIRERMCTATAFPERLTTLRELPLGKD